MQDALEHVPLYVHAKEVHLPDGSLEALELTFLTFYGMVRLARGVCESSVLPHACMIVAQMAERHGDRLDRIQIPQLSLCTYNTVPQSKSCLV